MQVLPSRKGEYRACYHGGYQCHVTLGGKGLRHNHVGVEVGTRGEDGIRKL